MRTVFYGSFDGNNYVGSHAKLVARQADQIRLGLPDLPFALGFPGLQTPYSGVLQYSPSTILNVGSFECRRIFGATKPESRSIEDAAKLIISRARSVATELVERKRCAVSLTAGIDSRITLGLLLPLDRELLFFTYHIGVKNTAMDTKVAADIAKYYGLNHKIILETGVINQYPENFHENNLILTREVWIPEHDTSRSDILKENTYQPHIPWLATTYQNAFRSNTECHIRSNILEFFRSSAVDKICEKFKMIPNSPEEAARVYLIAAARKGIRKYQSQAAEHFRQLFDSTSFDEAMVYTDCRDLYFLEHRMAAWHGNLVNESDIGFDTAILYNSREMLEAGRSIPKTIRMETN